MKTNIVICQGSSCFSRGNKENLTQIQKFLKDKIVEAEVSFKGQLCMNACTESPVILINGVKHIEMDKTKTLAILNAHFNQ